MNGNYTSGSGMAKSIGRVTDTPSANDPTQALVKSSKVKYPTYHDPEGFHDGKMEKSDKLEALREDVGWSSVFSDFNEQVERQGGEGIYKAAERTLEKAYTTGNVSLPLFVAEDFYVSDNLKTPTASLLPRVAVDEKKLEFDEVQEVAQAGSFTETGTVPDNDDTFANDNSYECVGIGRQNEVSDLLQITRSEASPMKSTQSRQVQSIRLHEEAQIYQGTGGNDASSFDGLPDLANGANVSDETDNGTEVSISLIRDVITALKARGSDYNDIVIAMSYGGMRQLKDEFDNIMRVEEMKETLSYGHQSVTFEGAMLIETQGIDNTAGNRALWGFDGSAHFFAMLRDATLKPLAPTSTTEQVATYVWETFVSQAPSLIEGYTNMD